MFEFSNFKDEAHNLESHNNLRISVQSLYAIPKFSINNSKTLWCKSYNPFHIRLAI